MVVSLNIFGSIYESMGQAFRYSSFQVMSIITTTGYATADYEQWPAMSQVATVDLHVYRSICRINRGRDQMAPNHALF
jgi:Trk-type K+ transport system membrane component